MKRGSRSLSFLLPDSVFLGSDFFVRREFRRNPLENDKCSLTNGGGYPGSILIKTREAI